MNQKISREQIRETVTRIVRQYESEIAAAQSLALPVQSSMPQQPANNPLVLEYFAPWTGEVYKAAHPSQQQFSIGNSSEAIPSASTEQCTIEKGKPCDQCGACRVLGF